MKNGSEMTQTFYKKIAGALVAVMISMSLLPASSNIRADQVQTHSSAEILYFEQPGPVVEKSVSAGTAREDLELPEKLRAKIAVTTTKSDNGSNAGISELDAGEVSEANKADGGSSDLSGSDNSAVDGENLTGSAGTGPVVDGDNSGDAATSSAVDGNNSSGEGAGSAVDGNNSGGAGTSSAATEINVTNGTTGNKLSMETSSGDELGAGAIFENESGTGALPEGIPGASAFPEKEPAIDNSTDNKGDKIRVGENSSSTSNVDETFEYFQNIPVIWEGSYDGDVPGIYILTAQVDNYTYKGIMPTAVITVMEETAGTGSISGFVWVDGNGDKDTDWDGLYNGNEWPLADYRISLYDAGDLTSALAVTRTDSNGQYAFENLKPGNYVLGLIGENIRGIDYLAPVFITSENKIAINWSIPGLPAYSEVIALAEDQSVQDINAGMRLPMGIRPLAYNLVSLNNLGNAVVNDYVKISQFNWNIVRIEIIDGVKYYLLAQKTQHNYNQINKSQFNKNGSPDYEGSEIQARMTAYYSTDSYYTLIKEIAVVPTLGDHNSTYATSEPTKRMAKSEGLTKDIMFALSYKDYVDWNRGATKTIYQPLNAYTRVWSRTAAKIHSTNDIYGLINLPGQSVQYHGIDAGLDPNGYSDIGEVPAVWINGDAVYRKVTVHYIDTDGNSISDSKTHEKIIIGENFTLPAGEPKKIGGYEYFQWKKGVLGTQQDGNPPSPTLTSQEVLNNTDIYLIYKKLTAEINVHYISKITDKAIRSPQTVTADLGKPHTLHNDHILKIDGYKFSDEWKESLTTAPVQTPPVAISSVTADMNIYLYYEYEAADVIISKEVTGEFGDRTLPFTFEIYMFSLDTEKPFEPNSSISIKGGVIAGSGAVAPSDTTKILVGGKFSVDLTHGQTITIENVPSHLTITIEEIIENDLYDTTIKYNDDPKIIEEYIISTALLDNPGGTRTFAFVNDHQQPVPTGFTDVSGFAATLPIIAGLLILVTLATSEFFKRRVVKK